jgi:phage terminase large subunit-like protein
LTPEHAYRILYDWQVWARPTMRRPDGTYTGQLPPPGSWRVWLFLAGRGAGKTRAGAEWVRAEVESGRRGRLALIGPTAADVRDVMVDGESGIRTISPAETRPVYQPTRRRLYWPHNGATALLYSAEEPDRLRGPQHDGGWCDELCLVAGTRIATEHGERPIEQVRAGDRVWTRAGLRRVRHAWCSSPSASVWELRTADGRTLVGTASHPIWVGGRGFVPLHTVSCGDTLTLWDREAGSPTTIHTPDLNASARCAVPLVDGHVVSVRPLTQRAAVYNLEVAGEHEYFANGILTHNCAWAYPETFDMFLFGLRLGDDPRAVVTTTPRPTAIIRELVTLPTTVLTRGTTYENAVNLAPSFLDQIVAKYQGTRLGRQELLAEILTDTPGALWKRDQVDALRVRQAPPLRRIVVAVDPEASSGEGAAETGIIVAGLGEDGHGYVLDDRTIRGTPDTWASAAVTAYHTWHADRLCAEINNGGEMVGYTIRTVDPSISYKTLHASRGKAARAEPVAALYEQGKVHHVGYFEALEEQLVSWVPGDTSPDRLDALVWALTELMLTGTGQVAFAATHLFRETPEHRLVRELAERGLPQQAQAVQAQLEPSPAPVTPEDATAAHQAALARLLRDLEQRRGGGF